MIANHQDRVELGEEALLGLLLADGPIRRIPARPWPLAAACVTLAELGQVLAPSVRSAAETGGAEGGEAAIEGWLRALAADRSLQVAGRGMSAHWIPADEWLTGWRLADEGLDASNRRPWLAARQTLSRTLSIWEKTLAAASSGSASSRYSM